MRLYVLCFFVVFVSSKHQQTTYIMGVFDFLIRYALSIAANVANRRKTSPPGLVPSFILLLRSSVANWRAFAALFSALSPCQLRSSVLHAATSFSGDWTVPFVFFFIYFIFNVILIIHNDDGEF